MSKPEDLKPSILKDMHHTVPGALTIDPKDWSAIMLYVSYMEGYCDWVRSRMRHAILGVQRFDADFSQPIYSPEGGPK